MLKITKTKDTVEESYLGVRLTIARKNSEAFVTKLRRLSKPHKRRMESGNLPEETARRIYAEAMAGTLLVGWVADDFIPVLGEPVPFNEANAADLLTNDQDCRNFVDDIAGSLDAFMLDEQAELEKKP